MALPTQFTPFKPTDHRDFPATPSKWEKRIAAWDKAIAKWNVSAPAKGYAPANAGKLSGYSLHDNPPYVPINSGSEIEWPQFLLLRVLYTKSNAADLQAKVEAGTHDLFAKASYDSARESLKENAEWNAYISDIEGANPGQEGSFPDLGLFTIPRYHQLATSEIKLRPTDQPPSTYVLRPRTNMPNYADHAAAVDALTSGVASSGLVHRERSHSSLSGKSATTQLSEHSAAGKDAVEIYPKAEDEQIVNTALIDYLISITITCKDVKGGWTLHRAAFIANNMQKSPYPKTYESRVDGYFQTWSGRKAAIIEVKPFIRSWDEPKIRMQEASQMAAWISQEPPESYQKGGKARRLLIAQDRHEVFLTIATFDKAYVEYIRNEPNRNRSARTFLCLKQCGPFTITKCQDMKVLSYLVLGFCRAVCAPGGLVGR
ncbi:hypothetical protein GGTG_10977 [Gaeumannomyces tritici R3-111a-1]|uniref:Uncharacterized protein n=1 Tax=Gaeumannomyces tritici (strain R3-111a-1) TaxID=644352 RepID=J3PBV5_GAET3|nr:hypothetical protein GGTG_10977 [Gaeumannomyces tritici R3-111a-1]EJT71723.1 hypothetical protein GGTG_10977 [Gaeumannomyces tritici R3-111a-1]